MDRVGEVLALLRQDKSLVVTSQTPSAFKDALIGLLPKDADKRQAGEEIIAALEVLISRQMTDSQRIISACVALSQITGLPIAKVIKKVEKATGHLKLPSPSWVAKNIRAAKVVALHPGLAKIEDVEKIATLKRLPEQKLKEVSETGAIELGGQQVDVIRASRREVSRVVREIVDSEKPETAATETKVLNVEPVASSAEAATDDTSSEASERETEARLEKESVKALQGASVKFDLSGLKTQIESTLLGLSDESDAYDRLKTLLRDTLKEIDRLDNGERSTVKESLAQELT